MRLDERIQSLKSENAPATPEKFDNAQALSDLRYLCEKSNMTMTYDLGLQAISYNSRKLARVLCIPFNVTDKSITIKKSMVETTDPQMCVALVCYCDNKPVNVFMFFSDKFVFKKKPISYNKKTNEYVITIKDVNSPKLAGFGFTETVGKMQ